MSKNIKINLAILIFSLALLVIPSYSFAIEGRCIVNDVEISASSEDSLVVANPDPKRCRTGAQLNYSPVVSNLVCYKSGEFCLQAMPSGADYCLRPPFRIANGLSVLFGNSRVAEAEYHLKVNDIHDNNYRNNSGGATFDVIFPNKVKRFIKNVVGGITGIFGTYGTPEIKIVSGVIRLTVDGVFGRKLTCGASQEFLANLDDVILKSLIFYSDGTTGQALNYIWRQTGRKLVVDIVTPQSEKKITGVQVNVCVGKEQIDPVREFSKDIYYPPKSCGSTYVGVEG